MESDAARVLREQVADRATAAERASGGGQKLLARLRAALRFRRMSKKIRELLIQKETACISRFIQVYNHCSLDREWPAFRLMVHYG